MKIARGVRPPLRTGLYVHVPFCVHKCGYCDFNSWAETSRAPQLLWLEAFERQVEFWAGRFEGRVEIDTIFFGGGTPSLLENELIVKAGRFIRSSFALADDCEWTMECNPETLTPEKLSALGEAGANRLSMGVQSFRDQHLERLERRARRADNLRALECLREHWKGRWSLDLMFGLPDQTPEEWREDLRSGLAFGPDHLSAYQLTLTTERSKNWSQPSEEILLGMFDETEAIAAEAGLKKYETSNFAKPGQECRHNLRYWRLGSFVGLGPGAAGLLSGALADDSENPFGSHQKNPDRFEVWRAGAGQSLAERAWLKPRSARDHLAEMLMMGLRLNEGFVSSRLGPLEAPIEVLLKDSQIAELLEKKSGRLIPTKKGYQQLDTLLPELLLKLEKAAPHELDSRDIDPTFE